ncbi:hypothetical protein QYF36_013543 [Acer negundo]|nr:hypothetical protein QYF36_013543 [Acer negundo]
MPLENTRLKQKYHHQPMESQPKRNLPSLPLRLTAYLSFSKTLSWLKARAIRLFGLFFLASRLTKRFRLSPKPIVPNEATFLFYPKEHKQTQAHSQKEEIGIPVESGESPFSRAAREERRFGSVANSFSLSGEVASAKEGYSSIQFQLLSQMKLFLLCVTLGIDKRLYISVEVKAYLIDVWDITERAVPQGCYAPATLVLIKMLCSARYTFAFYPIPA